MRHKLPHLAKKLLDGHHTAVGLLHVRVCAVGLKRRSECRPDELWTLDTKVEVVLQYIDAPERLPRIEEGSGAVRSAAQLSVGTREQLSTLYRLSLAEYLQTVIVLDDQLVQSDDTRMDWFRTLLTDKAHGFQIVVVTRPADYLPASALVLQGSAIHAHMDSGFIRAVDLGRALRRR